MPIGVVLVEPRYPENIGAVARACANFGAERLVVVNPQNLDWTKIRAMATKGGQEFVDKMRICSSLEEALSSFNWAVASTARLGTHRKVYKTLREIAPDIAAKAKNNRVALVFGNEKWGLSNEELFLCNDAFTIPTAGYSSLNVAQAVVLTLYEVFCAASNVKVEKPKLATYEEQQQMYDRIKELCEVIGYVPHDNVPLWMSSIRRFLSKMELTSREARMVQGFCRKMIDALRRRDGV